MLFIVQSPRKMPWRAGAAGRYRLPGQIHNLACASRRHYMRPPTCSNANPCWGWSP